MLRTCPFKYLFIILVLCPVASVMAQSAPAMHIHFKNGSKMEVATEQVDSITFGEPTGGEEEERVEEGVLTGSWMWGSVEAGYYEVLTLNEDKTFTGYDNYFTYGFDMMTYGYYSQYGIMLNLWSNGFGYQRRYNWYLLSLTPNALEVMTRTGPFTYYRLQPEEITLDVGQAWICDDDDEYVFADNVVACIMGNSLIAIATGETYIQKKIGKTNNIVAYKVVVK